MGRSIRRSASVTKFLRYKRELHRYLIRRLRNPNDVDDLAQEVFRRLLMVDESKAIDKPLAYLYGVASHVLADDQLEKKRWKGLLIFDSQALEEAEADKPAFIEDDLADRLNLQQQIDKAVAQLPPTQAAVLLAHKRDGMSYEEVAEYLGLSIHTVEKYVTQAKSRIRTMTWER